MGLSRLFRDPGARFTRIGRRLLLVSVPIEPVLETLEAAGLTRAEREVIELALKRLSNAEIATRRCRSPRTIAKQLAAAYRKLGVGSRRELAAKLGK